jgi:hypothetical protein
MTDSYIRGGTFKTIPGYSRYEVSDRGYIRNVITDRLMAMNPNNEGYLRLSLVRDDGKRVNVLVHRCVLLAHAGPPQDGQEACHGEGGQLDNRYPENLRWGTKPENERDKIAAGTTPKPNPTHPCKDGCGALVISEGRRCLDCVQRVGREATAMLNRGVNLYDVAEHFGYTAPDWVWRLAVEHGACALTKRQALTQHPPSLSQRVTATLRGRFGRHAGGDAT